MAIKSVRCPVLGARVMHVTDLEGAVTRVLCSEYDASTGRCRRRWSHAGAGPLAQLLERTAVRATARRTAACILRVR